MRGLHFHPHLTPLPSRERIKSSLPLRERVRVRGQQEHVSLTYLDKYKHLSQGSSSAIISPNLIQKGGDAMVVLYRRV